MTLPVVTTPNLPSSQFIDALIGHLNQDGILSTRQISINALKGQLAGTPFGGVVSFGSKAEMDASLLWLDGTLGWVLNDGNSANNWVWRYTGEVGTGTWVKGGSNFLSWIAGSMVTNDVQRVLPHADFSFVNDFGRVYACPGPGLARHDMDVAIAWQRKYKQLTGTSGVNYLQNTFGPADQWVSAALGNDANGGGPNSPRQTIKKGLQNTSHTVVLLPGRYKLPLDLEVADRNNSGAPRPTRIKAFIPGTVILEGADQAAVEMNWVPNVGTGFFEATPSGGKTVASITYITATGLMIPVPYDAALSAGFCWNQGVSPKKITIRAWAGLDVNAEKARFHIVYIPATNSSLRGVKLLLEDIDFIGHPEIDMVYDGGYRAEVFFKRCRNWFSPQNAYRPQGAYTAFQGCETYGSAADGWNYYPDLVDDTKVCHSVEIDCKAAFAGWMHQTSGVPGTRSHQSSSGHPGSRVARFNGDYGRGNWGQGIADTGANSKYWMAGTIVRDPGFDLYSSTTDDYDCVQLEGTWWIDNCQFGGRGSRNGLVRYGTGKQFKCDIRGNTADIVAGSGTLADYTPANP